MFIVNIVLGFGIGLTLGLLGGGGSILTVPALVYIVGQPPQTAVTVSLIIVGLNSALGAFIHRSQGTLNWRVALVFGGVGMLAAYLSAGLSKAISQTVLMVLFAGLMLVIGTLMIARKTPENDSGKAHGWPVIIGSGLAVGVLTGFLGVGGGFLIVPALVMLVGLPMRQAVGTSLIVIAMNSLAGFLGHLGGPAFDMDTVGVIVTFVLSGLVGAITGARLTKVVKPEQLRRAFAVFVIALGVMLLADNLTKLIR